MKYAYAHFGLTAKWQRVTATPTFFIKVQRQYQDLHFKMVALGAGRDEPSQLLQLLSICHISSKLPAMKKRQKCYALIW